MALRLMGRKQAVVYLQKTQWLLFDGAVKVAALKHFIVKLL